MSTANSPKTQDEIHAIARTLLTTREAAAEDTRFGEDASPIRPMESDSDYDEDDEVDEEGNEDTDTEAAA